MSTIQTVNDDKELLPLITLGSNNSATSGNRNTTKDNSNNEYYQFTFKIPRWHVVVKRESVAWLLVGLSSLLLIFINLRHSAGDQRIPYAALSSSMSFKTLENNNDPPPLSSQGAAANNNGESTQSETTRIPMSEEGNYKKYDNYYDLQSTERKGGGKQQMFIDLETGKPILQTFYGRSNNKDNNSNSQSRQSRGYANDAFEGGSCWCIPSPTDDFCSCTPSVAIDVILTAGPNYVWVIRRKKESHKLACMGGFVEVGETPEEAVARELMEETSLTLTSPPRFFGIYSDPRRDIERHRHSVSIVYTVDIPEQYKPIAGDDASEVIRIHVGALEKEDFFIDHKVILMDYKKFIAGTEGSQVPKHFWSTVKYDDPIKRAVCHDPKNGYTPDLDT